MRIAAGILMILYGLKTIGFLVAYPVSEWGYADYLDPLDLVIIISNVFIITGGVFCLKRKYWKLCLASSLCLLLFMIFDLYPLYRVPFKFFIHIHIRLYMTLYLPMGILPLIFVLRRESEWQEISA
jgi:hypothetical protein